MLSILGLVTGLAGPIFQVVGKLTDLKIARVQATSDEEKARIDAQIQEAHDRQAVLTAEAGSRLNAIIRGLLALGPMLYLCKVFIFDKVIGAFMGQSCFRGSCSVFNTDPLDDNLWKVVVAVIAFYFVYDMAANFRKK